VVLENWNVAHKVKFDDVIKRFLQLPLDIDNNNVTYLGRETHSTRFKYVSFFFYMKIQTKKTFLGGNLLTCIFDRL